VANSSWETKRTDCKRRERQIVGAVEWVSSVLDAFTYIHRSDRNAGNVLALSRPTWASRSTVALRAFLSCRPIICSSAGRH